MNIKIEDSSLQLKKIDDKLTNLKFKNTKLETENEDLRVKINKFKEK